MLGSTVVAAIAAVLTPGEVVFVDVAAFQEVRRVALGAEGAALFAAPDGRFVVPLAGEDATLLVSPVVETERWKGRVFPIFSREFDRMYVFLPGTLKTLTYPERVPIDDLPVEDLVGIRRAACSWTGRLVAVVPDGDGGKALVMMTPGAAGGASRIGMPDLPESVAVEPRAEWVAAGLRDGRVVAIGVGRTQPAIGVGLGAPVRALATSADGRWLFAGIGDETSGWVVGLRVTPTSGEPVKEMFRTPTLSAPVAVAAFDRTVLVLTGTGLHELTKHGKRLERSLELDGGRSLALMVEHPRTAVPAWSDR
ncbi:MAG: hypothetical protein ACOY3Y_03915 [Acidobacteriota bacterium]